MSQKQKTIAIVGCGPNLGMAVARRFGKEGYQIGMISFMPEELETFVKELEGMGIKAAAFPADITKRDELIAALTKLRAEMGPIDIVEYSPLAPMFELVDVLDINPENTQYYIEQQLYGAMTVVNEVLPEMLARGEGSILVTTGATAIIPMSSHANGAVSQCAVRHYIYLLNDRLQDKGIYVGTLCIAAAKDDTYLANLYWDMNLKRDRVEEIYGNIKPVAAYQSYVNRGYADTYPPKFTKEPPEPRNEEERNKLLVALYFCHISAGILDEVIAKGETEKSIKFIEPIVLKYGGDLTKEYFGGTIDLI